MVEIKLRKMIMFLSIMLCAGFIQAQESLNTSGGDASGSGGTVAYSIGQLVYTTASDASGSINQGVQQTYDISTLGVNNAESGILLSAFPNPTATNLTLLINNFNNESMSYQLFDIQGRLLSKEPIKAKQTQVNMVNLPSAVYFINVINQNAKTIQSFKIIKK